MCLTLEEARGSLAGRGRGGRGGRGASVGVDAGFEMSPLPWCINLVLCSCVVFKGRYFNAPNLRFELSFWIIILTFRCFRCLALARHIAPLGV